MYITWWNEFWIFADRHFEIKAKRWFIPILSRFQLCYFNFMFHLFCHVTWFSCLCTVVLPVFVLKKFQYLNFKIIMLATRAIIYVVKTFIMNCFIFRVMHLQAFVYLIHYLYLIYWRKCLGFSIVLNFQFYTSTILQLPSNIYRLKHNSQNLI